MNRSGDADPAAIERGPAPHAGSFVPGAVLGGRYRIVARVGRGGMGEVFRADDLRLGQPVALKFLPPELEEDDEARDRLLAEVRLARAIAHPNVCRVFDVGDLPAENGAPARSFITMEYIDGEDLGTLLRRIGRLPSDKAVAVARQLCAGLAAAHDKGVLHRDLKPSNVMLDGRGHVRIADFGIAVEVSAETGAADNAGTAAYMAPERFYGEPASVRSDLYALGLILYEIVTGRSALNVSSPLEWPKAHATSVPSDPSVLVADTDPAMVQTILRCLEKDPADRPGSAAEVAAALPGGDPLAAALAAGETPSPELVAASGEKGTLPRGKAWAWFAAVVAIVGMAVWSLASVLLINHTPIPFDTGTLERQARELMLSFGYTIPPTDWRSFWRRDTRREPHMIRLTYRQSPQSLFETLEIQADWPAYPEDARVYLDSRGRLIGFDIGGDLDYSDTTGAQPTDWAPMLAALGADAPPVPSTPGRWPPAFYADTRAAWTATIDGVPHDVEAASLRGRPVSLRLKPVDAPDERPAPQRGAGAAVSAITSFTFLVVLALLVGLARRNIRLGRGDRSGATRLALIVGLTFVVGFALIRHWNFENPNLLARGVIYTLQLPLLLGVAVWLGYVGIEPYVRRRWPSLLIGWTRLLEGRVRDGLVGQALLAGVAVGSLLTLLRAGLAMLMASVGTGTPYLYRDEWQTVAGPLFATGGTIVGSIVLVGLLVLARLVLRRDWAAWLVIGVFVALFTLGEQNAADVVRITLPMWVLLPIAVASAGFTMEVLRRFGLLALVVAGSVNGMLLNAPLTLDPAHWYFWRGAWVMAIVLALAAWGFVNVLGRQSLLPAEALDG